MRFVGRYQFLSNFYSSPVRYKHMLFPTVEHAYQASKTLDRSSRTSISKLITPTEAKRAGRKVKLREDWNDVKLAIMETLLRQKFTGSMGRRLINVQGPIIEDNYWGDTYWGICRGQGSNHLGRILEKIRDEI